MNDGGRRRKDAHALPQRRWQGEAQEKKTAVNREGWRPWEQKGWGSSLFAAAGDGRAAQNIWNMKIITNVTALRDADG